MAEDSPDGLRVIDTNEREFDKDGKKRKVAVSTLEDGSFGLEFTTDKEPGDIKGGKPYPIADAVQEGDKIVTRVHISPEALEVLKDILNEM